MASALQYRRALLTGVSTGLGRAFARMLLAEGVEVWGTARSLERAAAVEGVRPLVLDLHDRESVAAAWQAVHSQGGAVDLLINNAGFAGFGRFDEIPAEMWESEVAAMLFGTARLARMAAAAMRERGQGTIVNVTSLVAEFPIPFMSAYNTAKAGLAALSATLEAEMSGTGVKVIDFRPGDYRTDFNRSMSARRPSVFTDERCSRVWERIEKQLAAAPSPERAARDLRRALRRGHSGVVRSGSFFQARLAPFLDRLAPVRLSRFCQRLYFDLG